MNLLFAFDLPIGTSSKVPEGRDPPIGISSLFAAIGVSSVTIGRVTAGLAGLAAGFFTTFFGGALTSPSSGYSENSNFLPPPIGCSSKEFLLPPPIGRSSKLFVFPPPIGLSSSRFVALPPIGCSSKLLLLPPPIGC